MARGTIVTRTAKDGSKRYDTVIRIDGKQRWKTFKKKKEAESYLDRHSTDVRDHTYREIIPASFKQYAERWRKKCLIPEELKESTLGVYSYILDRHLISTFELRPMAAITTADITDFRVSLLKSGYSMAHVGKIVNLLYRLFDDAREDGYVKLSPMPQRRKKKSKRSKVERKARALQYQYAQLLLEQCETDAETDREADPELKLVILLGLLAGLRRGEIFALDFSDIDFEKDLIHVRRNLFWRYGKHHDLADDEPRFLIYSPKSDKSARDIDLSPALKDALWNRYMEMQMEDRTGLIFQTENGTPLDPSNVHQRQFKPAVERAKDKAAKKENDAAVQALDGLTLHHLRHTFGSWKIAQGEDVLYVSAQMGHARPSITYDIYAHLLDKRRPHAAAKTDDALFGKPALRNES